MKTPKTFFTLASLLVLTVGTLVQASDDLSAEYAGRYVNQYEALRMQAADEEEAARRKAEVEAFDREAAMYSKKATKKVTKQKKAKAKQYAKKKVAKKASKQIASKKSNKSVLATKADTSSRSPASVSTASASAPLDFSTTVRSAVQKFQAWASGK